MTLRGCCAVTSSRILVPRAIIRRWAGALPAHFSFPQNFRKSWTACLPPYDTAVNAVTIKAGQYASKPSLHASMFSQVTVLDDSTFHDRVCREKNRFFFNTTKCLICRLRWNVLLTFVLPCLCAFSSTPTLRCPVLRAQPIPCLNPKPAMCCSHGRTFFHLIAFASGGHLLAQLARLLLQSAIDIFVSLRQLMPRTLVVQ